MNERNKECEASSQTIVVLEQYAIWFPIPWAPSSSNSKLSLFLIFVYSKVFFRWQYHLSILADRHVIHKSWQSFTFGHCSTVYWWQGWDYGQYEGAWRVGPKGCEGQARTFRRKCLASSRSALKLWSLFYPTAFTERSREGSDSSAHIIPCVEVSSSAMTSNLEYFRVIAALGERDVLNAFCALETQI